jgi:5'-nucleotidase
MIIYVDVDGVTADLITEWLRRYNRDYNDDLTPQEILDWGIEKYVKPECGMNIFTYLRDRNLYNSVEPIEDALYFVHKLRKDGHNIIFVTDSPFEASGVKFQWLNQYGFEVDKDHYIEISANTRSLLAEGIFLDDNPKTVAAISDCGTVAILMRQPWNEWSEADYVAGSWAEFYKLVKETILRE